MHVVRMCYCMAFSHAFIHHAFFIFKLFTRGLMHHACVFMDYHWLIWSSKHMKADNKMDQSYFQKFTDVIRFHLQYNIALDQWSPNCLQVVAIYFPLSGACGIVPPFYTRHCFIFHWHQQWGTIYPTNCNNGALLFPLTPTTGHNFFRLILYKKWGIIPSKNNNGALIFQLVPRGHYSSSYCPRVIVFMSTDHPRRCFLLLILEHFLLPLASVWPTKIWRTLELPFCFESKFGDPCHRW